jgi:hypothetical protein
VQFLDGSGNDATTYAGEPWTAFDDADDDDDDRSRDEVDRVERPEMKMTV